MFLQCPFVCSSEIHGNKLLKAMKWRLISLFFKNFGTFCISCIICLLIREAFSDWYDVCLHQHKAWICFWRWIWTQILNVSTITSVLALNIEEYTVSLENKIIATASWQITELCSHFVLLYRGPLIFLQAPPNTAIGEGCTMNTLSWFMTAVKACACVEMQCRSLCAFSAIGV